MLKSTKPYEIGLNIYFNNPEPILSAENVDFITNQLKSSKINYFIEYGIGSSTIYFSEILDNRNLTYIGVEVDLNWASQVSKQLQKKSFDLISLQVSRYSLTKFIQFIVSLNERSDINEKFSRRIGWKKKYLLGPFYRFEENSGSKLSGKLPFWKMLKYLMIFINLSWMSIYRKKLPADALFNLERENLNICLKVIGPPLKDQHGESPTKVQYIDAGLRSIENDLIKNDKDIHASFLIDGGPRAEILKRILDLEESFPNFFPTIYLCEAYRNIYSKQIARRNTGKFIKGSNITINGRILIEEVNKNYCSDFYEFWYGLDQLPTISYLQSKELWFYRREN